MPTTPGSEKECKPVDGHTQSAIFEEAFAEPNPK